MKGVIDPYPEDANNTFGDVPEGAESARPVCSVCLGCHRIEPTYHTGAAPVGQSCLPPAEQEEAKWRAYQMRGKAASGRGVRQFNALVAEAAGGDYRLADKVLHWIDALRHRGDDLPDHLAALVVLLDTTVVFPPQFALAGGAVSAYQAEQRAEAQKKLAADRAAANLVGAWVGTVGQRQQFGPLTCVEIKPLGPGDYGERFLIRFSDAAGNVLIWFTGEGGLFDPEPGGVYYCTATVKDHGTFGDQRQTILTRPTETTPEGETKNPRKRKPKT